MRTTAKQKGIGAAAISSRMRRLPVAFKKVIEAGTRTHLENVREVLKTGLISGNLVTPPLSRLTRQIRKAQGRGNLPKTPLVGDQKAIQAFYQPNSITKIGDHAWRLRPVGFASRTAESGKTSRISWERVWGIHENGAVIPVTPKMFGAFSRWWGITLRARVLRIPARHALQKANQKYLRSQRRREVDRVVRAKLKELIKRTAS